MSEFESQEGMSTSQAETQSQGAEAPATEPSGSEREQFSGAELTAGEGESMVNEPAQSEPRYIDRETFDQAISGLTQEFTRRFEQLQTYMAQTPPVPQYQNQAAKPQEPEFPDYTEFEQQYLADPANFYKLNQRMWQELKQTRQQLAERVERLQQEIKTREYAEQVYNYLHNQTEAVTKQYPVFRNPQAKELLKAQVAVHLQMANGDLQQLDIPKIARDLNNLITQIQGISAARGQAGSQPQVKPASAPQGSATKPIQKGPGPEKLESLDDLDAMIDAVAQQAASIGGE